MVKDACGHKAAVTSVTLDRSHLPDSRNLGIYPANGRSAALGLEGARVLYWTGWLIFVWTALAVAYPEKKKTRPGEGPEKTSRRCLCLRIPYQLPSSSRPPGPAGWFSTTLEQGKKKSHFIIKLLPGARWALQLGSVIFELFCNQYVSAIHLAQLDREGLLNWQ